MAKVDGENVIDVVIYIQGKMMRWPMERDTSKLEGGHDLIQ